jgi:small subunit ribosomal protein S10
MKQAKIALSGPISTDVDMICKQIKEIAKKSGVHMKGPIPLPTKRLLVPVRKGPDGRGTTTIDHWEMRIHKRVIFIDPDDTALRSIMRIQVPDNVSIEIALIT